MNVLNTLVAYSLPLVPKFIVRQFSKRYVAGDDIQDAVSVIKALNEKGIVATADVLGEFCNERKKAEASAEIYFELLRAIEHNGLQSHVSVKLTQLGLKIDKTFCLNIVRQIIKSAKSYNNFVRLDMEDSSCTSDTIDIFLALKKEYDNVGVVLQSYLRRTSADAMNLAGVTANIRLCKGIYIEPRTIAYKDPTLINQNFLSVLEFLLQRRSYTGIATHDEKLVFGAERIIENLKLKTSEYEFQMLLGVDEELRDIIVERSHPMRVYVPFGRDWHSYCVRRLKENPQIAGYVMKAMMPVK